MLFDNIIFYEQKVIIAVICSGFWIYFRTSQCYDLIPRKHIFPVLFVMNLGRFELLSTIIFTFGSIDTDFVY
jgi:hypothetical protein